MMQKFDVSCIMYKSNNIRNVAVISHLNNGKSNLFAILEASSLPLHHLNRFLDFKPSDDRPIYLNSDVHTMFFKIPSGIETPKDTSIEDVLINLIDSPIDSSTGVTSLRIADGTPTLFSF